MVSRLRGAWSPQNFTFPPRFREDITYNRSSLHRGFHVRRVFLFYIRYHAYSCNITLLGTSHLKLIGVHLLPTLTFRF